MRVHTRVASERGVGLVEVLVTILVLFTGVLTSITVISSSGRLAAEADRYGVIVSVAQREIERLRPLPYDRLGMSGPISPQAVEAPLTGVAASEPAVGGGVIAPGPEPFEVQGIKGRIYRYVTWRAQTCPLLTDKVALDVSQVLGQSQSDVQAALSTNLCPGIQQTKRVTVVVKAEEVGGLKPRTPYRLATVATDPTSSLLSSGNYDGLKVDVSGATQTLTGPSSEPAATYAAAKAQELFLYDTRCNQSTRQAITANHETMSTALQGSTCGGSSQPDLMGLAAIPGAAGALLHDYSNDITRPAQGGLALLRDSVAGGCDQDLSYSGADAERRRSVHVWSTPAVAGPTETAASGGRATLTFWTRTADVQTAPGRLCLAVVRKSTGEVLGSSDYRMPSWPGELTQLAVSMEIEHATLAAGDRLLVVVRVPQDSGADLQLLYDHPSYPSNLSIAMQQERPFT